MHRTYGRTLLGMHWQFLYADLFLSPDGHIQYYPRCVTSCYRPYTHPVRRCRLSLLRNEFLGVASSRGEPSIIYSKPDGQSKVVCVTREKIYARCLRVDDR